MDRTAVAKELVKLAKSIAASKINFSQHMDKLVDALEDVRDNDSSITNVDNVYDWHNRLDELANDAKRLRLKVNNLLGSRGFMS
jgi:hypothetical protein